nr:alpha/beta fold hydrolase [uncultured Duganella sp.]
MIKRLMILVLAGQAVFVGLLAAGLYCWWRPAWQAGLNAAAIAAFYLACGLAGALLVRLLVPVNNFYWSRRAASATPPAHALNLFSATRLFCYEFQASLLTSSYYMLRPLGMQLQPEAQGLPVLLVHGYACNSGYWRPMSKLLRQARISHYGVDLEPLGASIDDFAPQIHAAVERLRKATGSAQVILVGHSMGGLVARAYLRRHGSAHIARVITLGTPHHGTALAHLGPGSNALQMRPHSEWLGTLAASEAITQRMLISSIYSVHDNIVAPQDSSALPGARNLVFGAIGHVALGRHPAILQCALKEITEVVQRAHA